MSKICTSIEQSKQLIELGIAVDTADMYYPNRVGMDNYALPIEWKNGNSLLSQEIPAWSLSALLYIYPIVVGKDMDMYCCWCNKKNLQLRCYEDPIDACVDMIIKLHEKNLI